MGGEYERISYCTVPTDILTRQMQGRCRKNTHIGGLHLYEIFFPPLFFFFSKKKKDVSVGSGNWVDKYLISELILASWLSYVVLIGWDIGGGRSAMVEGILPVLGVRAALCLCRCSDIVLAIGMLLRRMRSTQGWGSAPRRSEFAGEYDMGRKM